MTLQHLAVDWSGGAGGKASRIWLAAVVAGRLVELRQVKSRPEAIREILAQPEPARIGLDFGFSFPRWYVESLGCSSGPELWELVGRHGEEWLAQCRLPLWGRPGRRRGPEEQLRRTEREVGGRAKSVFQIGGAGSVGTGSIRGMPALAQLRAAGFAIWPFEDSARSVVVEIYPRLLTGPGPKRDQDWRHAYLERLGWPADGELRALASSNEHAFDAAVSALRMWQNEDLLTDLPAARDETDLLEGRIWEPRRSVSGAG